LYKQLTQAKLYQSLEEEKKKMSLKYKLAQLSLFATLFVGVVAALPVGNATVLTFGSPDITTMGECSGGTGCTT
jgi:hypothetical protein